MGFSGTRGGMTAPQKASFADLLRQLRPSQFHHGDCIGGDEDAHGLVLDSGLGTYIVVHPPDNPSRRAFVQGAHEYREPYPYLERNRHIVDETQHLVATPGGFDEEQRSGTASPPPAVESEEIKW